MVLNNKLITQADFNKKLNEFGLVKETKY